MSAFIRRMISRRRRKICPSASELVGRPSLMLPPSFVEEEKVVYKFYSPLNKEGTVLVGGRKEVDLVRGKHNRWVGSSHGWLVLYGRRGSHEMCLLNPLSGRRIHLPPLCGEPFYNKDGRPYPLKVILTHSPGEEECRAVMILGSRDRVAFCSPGRCESWSPLGVWYDLRSCFWKHEYNDFVYSAPRKTLLSAVRNRTFSGGWGPEELEFWDASSSMAKPVKKVTAPCYSISSDPGDIWRAYLVSEEESGQLFMVRRYLINNEKVDYNVYSITTDDNGDDVVQLCESLDGLIMFIGVNHGFAVKASKYPEYKPNHIYFSGLWYHRHRFVDMYNHKSKAYSQLIDLSPNQNSPFHSPLPWFTLSKSN